MINKALLRNFRGIQNAHIDLGPLTILTGSNNSGKSSLMYGLLVLKNIVSNTNQPIDNFFNIGFLNLGGFKENVSLKEDDKRRIEIAIESHDQGFVSQFKVVLGKEKSNLALKLQSPYSLSLLLETNFPYALNMPVGTTLATDDWSAKITWNGITPTVNLEKFGDTEEKKKETIRQLSQGLISAVEDLKRVDSIPLKRGFSKPFFQPATYTPQLLSEDEIASLLANDRELESNIEYYLEKILNKKFRARQTSLGASSFYLQTTDKQTAFVCDLVNEGFGTNQLIYLLAKALRPGQETVCIEEPEIHLHPGAVDNLAEAISDIAKEKQRYFIISTHSEHFVISVLNLISREKISTEDVRLYHVRKEGKESRIELQEINEKGQVRGGLRGFYDVELKQLKEFLNIS